MTADVHDRKKHHDQPLLYSGMTKVCTVARRYPTTLFWVLMMAMLIAVTAGTASALVGIIGLQLFILGLLMHELAITKGRGRNG